MSAMQALLDDPTTAGRWRLVPDRSSVRFKNKTFWGLATVTGEFTDVRGSGEITATGAVSGTLDIRASSLKTGIGKRDEHLRSADFFDVEKHPEIHVEVSSVTPTGEAQATLTVRGTTTPLPLSATVERAGDGTVRVTAQTAIDRTTLGVSGNMIGMMPTTTTLLADVVFAKE
ncbi:YceI family protein [Mycobacterium sp. CVI_P3]|uniref:YceI family protein n=1 Tax=Mycobacterium pinniadriaticum TaxID=2994102 RepID=A0ABT3SGH4_9MYCO|nr:YceI family protein [Mycobacterium pinniadriaticum]MCX2932149.1 YceI family protein [Mycobacterium pinniadriaticum]MCX2938573.1 YceI family protein [Mycobacterium pinniadriaticum]